MVNINILVVCQRYYPEPFRITDICKGLTQRGHKVTVLTGIPNYPEGKIYKDYKHHKSRKEIVDGIKIIRCGEIAKGSGSNGKLFANYLSFMISSSFKSIFLRDKFDVILSNQTSPVSMVAPAIILKKRKKIKLLIYCMDLWPASLVAGGMEEKSFLYKSFFKFSKWIYKSADSICVTSRKFQEYFNDILQISKTIYLPQYSEELFKKYKKDSTNEFNMKEKSDKTLNLMFAGSIGRTQGIDTIIEAAKILKGRIPFKIHILGDGAELNNYKTFADKLNVCDIVKFYGRKPIESMPKYYSMADAMLVTLKKSGFISYTLPGKVQTYMASGKPIIGAIDGETMDIINESKCGFCCEAENSEKLAEIILKFYYYENKKELCQNSYNYYINNFTREHFIDRLEQELKLLV